MALPADAFAEISPADLPVGSVLRFRESWALLVSIDDDQPKNMLMLTGDRAGQLFAMGQGLPRCMAVVGPFSWFAAVDEKACPERVEHLTATLTLTTGGPVIIGAKIDRFDDEDYRAFGLDGALVEQYEPYGAGLRYTEWTAELQHDDRKFQSLGRLFSVRVGQA